MDERRTGSGRRCWPEPKTDTVIGSGFANDAGSESRGTTTGDAAGAKAATPTDARGTGRAGAVTRDGASQRWEPPASLTAKISGAADTTRRSDRMGPPAPPIDGGPPAAGKISERRAGVPRWGP